MMDIAPLLLACAPLIAQDTAVALIDVESSFNAFAIGVVGDTLVRQPRNAQEALATIAALDSRGHNYSVGLAQINKKNFARLGLTAASAFEPCTNLRAMESILLECFERASKRAAPQPALRDALSCYYSGNFETGYRHGYVSKVLASAARSRGPPRAQLSDQEPNPQPNRSTQR